MHLHGTSRLKENGHLEIGGVDTVDMAQRYGTPLYIMDEEQMRLKCRAYIRAFRNSGVEFQVAYASKAFCTKAMCRLIEEEGLSLDVVSDGELYTALQAGFPAERIHFHGNNKTPAEIEMALEAGIGCFVVDNLTELHLLHAIAREQGKVAPILLRLTPGVEAHTHDFISTGQEDSKFGFNIANGQAYEAVQTAVTLDGVNLIGIHSHIGSQIFEVEGFRLAVQRLVEFAVEVREKLQVVFKVVNMGGGFGIRYVEGDSPLPVDQYITAMIDEVVTGFKDQHYPIPELWIEPGRSIVGEAGTTLYTIGSVKNIPGVRKYVSVDGGMTDNPRPALYQAKYEAMLANRGLDPIEEVVTIAGKCCETGDMLIWDIPLPAVKTGDILAVSCTGAYNYSMSSNYNRIRRPAVVFVKEGKAELVVKRETLQDLVQNDIVPESMLKEKVAK